MKGGTLRASAPMGVQRRGVNVDKLGLYSPAERASRTERDMGWPGEREGDDEEEKDGKKRSVWRMEGKEGRDGV